MCVYIYIHTHTHPHIYSFNPNTKMKSDKHSLKKKSSCSQCKGAMPYFHLGKGNQAVLEALDSLRPLTDYLQGSWIWCLADSWGELSMLSSTQLLPCSVAGREAIYQWPLGSPHCRF